MSTSFVTTDSLLAIDVGTTHTRAILFDMVDGRYRFLAAGSAVTTAGTPFQDISEGINRALESLEDIAGRQFLRDDQSIIVPSGADGSGVDMLAATFSVGPPLKVVTVGLLEDVSLTSARRLAAATYAQVVENLNLNDRRKQDERLDLILHTRPDLIIAAGGTDNGADQSLRRLLETVGMACRLLPRDQRPEILFAGNKKVRRAVKKIFSGVTPVSFAPNIRPELEFERVEAAHFQAAEVYKQIKQEKLKGVQALDARVGGRLIPGNMAFGRVIRFLSQLYDPGKGVLGLDVGATSTTVAAGFAGNLHLGSYPEFGLGSGLPELLEHTELETISRWLTVEISKNNLRDYIYQKAAYPTSIPATVEEMAIEQALARAAIRLSVQKTQMGFPKNANGPKAGLLPWFEPILARGAIFTQAPSLAHSLMLLLNGLQPTGISTVLLDQNNLTAALGAAAEVNPTLVVQVLEANMLNLAAVISPVGEARPGTPILRIIATSIDGTETRTEVKFGSLEVLPVPLGQTIKLRLQPLHRFDIGMGGPGRGGRLRMVGGALGLVIDARGRPVALHDDRARQQELFAKWLWTLGK